MDFKIDRRAQTIGIRSDQNLRVTSRTPSESEETETALNREQESASKAELESFGEEQAATGDNLVISNIKQALSTASEALSEVIKLKTKALHIVREYQNLPYVDAHHENLRDEEDAATDEITRIQQTTSISGTNPFQSGRTFSYDSSSDEVHESLVTAALSQQTRNRYSLDNQADAASTESTFESEIVSYRANTAAISGAQSKAEKLNPDSTKEIFVVKNERPDSLESVEQAQQLANSIAQKLGSAFGDETTTAQLIESSAEGLDLDRVKNLLS